MPLIFRCDSCLWEDEVYPWDAAKLERICVGCGMEGCFKCLPDSYCCSCIDNQIDDEE